MSVAQVARTHRLTDSIRAPPGTTHTRGIDLAEAVHHPGSGEHTPVSARVVLDVSGELFDKESGKVVTSLPTRPLP